MKGQIINQALVGNTAGHGPPQNDTPITMATERCLFDRIFLLTVDEKFQSAVVSFDTDF